MSITIAEINNKNTWENFLQQFEFSSFLQSWNMGEVHEAIGERIIRLGVYDGNELTGVAMFVCIKSRRGKFLFCPYGPFLKDWQKYFGPLIEHVRKIAKYEHVDFTRISPFLPNTQENWRLFQNAGFKKAPIHMLSELSWILPLDKNEEELMLNMRKTHRNLIRRAIKENVQIEKSTDDQALEGFLKLHRETVKRHRFTPYPDKLFINQVKKFRDDNQVMIFTARHEGVVLASAIIMYFGNQGAYHHGASLPSKIPASYLLQWEAIKEAKQRGKKYYNFWGIAPDNAPASHPFKGITLFKTGFGGGKYELLPCQDRPLTFKYNLTKIVEAIRRKKRGF